MDDRRWLLGLSAAALLQALVGCGSLYPTELLPGGVKAARRVSAELALGADAATQMARHGLEESFRLPLVLPDDPEGTVLRVWGRAKYRMHPLRGDIVKRLERRLSAEEPVSAGFWRKLVLDFDYEPDLPESIRPNRRWRLQAGLYDSLPLDGSYSVAFVPVQRSRRNAYGPGGEAFMLLLISSEGNLAGTKAIRSYVTDYGYLKRIKREGVYF